MPCWTSDIAVWSDVSWWTGTGASGGLAHAIIQTLALPLTVWTIMACLTLCVTVVAMVTWGTVAHTSDRMTELIHL